MSENPPNPLFKHPSISKEAVEAALSAAEQALGSANTFRLRIAREAGDSKGSTPTAAAALARQTSAANTPTAAAALGRQSSITKEAVVAALSAAEHALSGSGRNTPSPHPAPHASDMPASEHTPLPPQHPYQHAPGHHPAPTPPSKHASVGGGSALKTPQQLTAGGTRSQPRSSGGGGSEGRQRRGRHELQIPPGAVHQEGSVVALQEKVWVCGWGWGGWLGGEAEHAVFVQAYQDACTVGEMVCAESPCMLPYLHPSVPVLPTPTHPPMQFGFIKANVTEARFFFHISDADAGVERNATVSFLVANDLTTGKQVGEGEGRRHSAVQCMCSRTYLSKLYYAIMDRDSTGRQLCFCSIQSFIFFRHTICVCAFVQQLMSPPTRRWLVRCARWHQQRKQSHGPQQRGQMGAMWRRRCTCTPPCKRMWGGRGTRGWSSRDRRRWVASTAPRATVRGRLATKQCQ
jgi:hypothetical protein